MLVTPSTPRSHGGEPHRSGSSMAAKGSTKPPMQASTWQEAPTELAMADISATGSTTPCGYCGAEATTRAVRSDTASANAFRSGVRSARTGTTRVCSPNRWAALWNAAWALSASTISGSWRPRSDRARSRAASTAHRMLSVPPLVTKPAAPSGPCRRSAVQAHRSDWMAASDGKAAVFRAFSWRNIRAASSATARTSSPPSNTRPKVRPSPHRTSPDRRDASSSSTSSAARPAAGKWRRSSAPVAVERVIRRE